MVQAFALLLRDPNGLRKMATTIASARPRPSQATRYLKTVLELFPHDVAVMNQLAAFAIDDERWDDAESYLKGALEAEPDLPDSYFNLGRVAQMRLEAQEASKASGGAADTRAVKPEEIKMWYEGALQRDPTHDKAMLYYGRYALNDVVGVVDGGGGCGGDLAVCTTGCDWPGTCNSSSATRLAPYTTTATIYRWRPMTLLLASTSQHCTLAAQHSTRTPGFDTCQHCVGAQLH